MAGIAFLNVMKPNWLKKIDLKKLYLGESTTCVIGEVFGDYFEGKIELDLTDEKADTLGFYIDENGNEENYSKLTSTWKKVLSKLKK